MLSIRKEQLKMFELHLNERFRTSLQEHVREDLTEESKELSDFDLEKRIDHAMERGLGYGLTSECDISLFLDLMILKGIHFDRDPKLIWARKILADPDMAGSAKMDAIYGRLAVLENRTAMPEEDEG